MRSEFLCLGCNNLPSEEELFEAYKKVAEIMGHRPVVIRTLDIDADKQVSYMGLEQEENPALALRGLRICLTREDIFRPPLRADPKMTEKFIEMGFTELSMAPGRVLETRKIVCESELQLLKI